MNWDGFANEIAEQLIANIDDHIPSHTTDIEYWYDMNIRNIDCHWGGASMDRAISNCCGFSNEKKAYEKMVDNDDDDHNHIYKLIESQFQSLLEQKMNDIQGSN